MVEMDEKISRGYYANRFRQIQKTPVGVIFVVGSSPV